MAEDIEELPPDDVNYSLIESGLYLGNLSTALDLKTLATLRISHILTIETKHLPENISTLPGIEILHIQVLDMPDEDLLSHFPMMTEFISSGQIKGNVLVHCYYGMSRSATGVAAYLMKKYSITADEALQRLKKARIIACPNEGFKRQLYLYQSLDYDPSPSKTPYVLYRLELASNAFRKGNFQPKSFLDIMASPNGESTPIIKCRKCRVTLVTKHSLIHHYPNEVPHWINSKVVTHSDSFACCYKGFFIQPATWMKDIFSKTHGKLFCPNCHNKLGPYNWITGCQCPCGATFRPGFLIVPSRVDIVPNMDNSTTTLFPASWAEHMREPKPLPLFFGRPTKPRS